MSNNVTVQKVLTILLGRIKFIIIVTLASTLVFFCVSNFFITPQYTTSSMIYVQNFNKSSESSSSSANEKNQKIYGSDISGSSSLAGVCITLFQNSGDITSLYNGCSVAMTAENFFITITVTGDDPQKCANVANQIAEETESVFENNIQYGQIGILRSATVPETAVSPNNLQNAMIGFLVGLVLSCLISILMELIDTTIKPDDDIQEMYGLPVFAEIPDFESQSR